MVEAVEDPGEEGVHLEEDALLAELVELGVAVEKAGGDELVEDAHDQWWEDGEEDVVEGERPGFVDDLAGEAVLERVLDLVRERQKKNECEMYSPRIESCTGQYFCRKNIK